jgi:hypothetical protein
VSVYVLAEIGQLSHRAIVDADDYVAVGAGFKRVLAGFERCARQYAVHDDPVVNGQTALRRQLRRDAGAVNGEPGVLRRYACAQIGQ